MSKPALSIAGLASLLCVLASPAPGVAQAESGAAAAADGTNSGAAAPARSYRAEPVDARAPTVDGHLDERVWESASFTSQMIQRDPDEGELASSPARVAVRFDEDDLYLAARMERDDPSDIRRQVTRRDEPGTSAALYVHLDPERDRRTAKVFGVTAAGVRVDYL